MTTNDVTDPTGATAPAPPMPAALVDLDITRPGFLQREDLYEALAWLRQHAPVHRLVDGELVVSRYDDIRAISRQPGLFSSRHGAIVNDPLRNQEPNDEAGSILHLDPPRHAEYRSLLNRRFTPRAAGLLEPAVRTIVDRVLGELRPGDEVDVVDAVAAPIPVAVIAELLGVADGDRADFQRWSDAVIEAADNPSDPETMGAMAELVGFLDDHIRARVAEPRDDLISALVGAEVGGEPLTNAQLLMFCITLLVAGNETTRALIAGSVLALAEHPEQRAALAASAAAGDDAALADAVEECLRWVTPIQAFCRTAMDDVTIAGTPVPAGSYLVMLYASGNRDESIFGPTADRFDVTRPPNPAHVAFGFGEHLCLGAALARLETRIVFEQFLRRFPTYQVLGEPTYVPSTLTRSIATLPIRA